MPFFDRDLRDAVRFLGFPNVRARRAIVVDKLDLLRKLRKRKHVWSTTTQAQSSTLAIVYTLSVLSFPTLFHSYLEETKTSDLEISHPD